MVGACYGHVLCSPVVNECANAHVSWSLVIDLGLLFVGVSLGGVVREEGGGCVEATAILGRRECVGRILHRVDVLDNDVAVADGVVY